MDKAVLHSGGPLKQNLATRARNWMSKHPTMLRSALYRTGQALAVAAGLYVEHRRHGAFDPNNMYDRLVAPAGRGPDPP